jgi:DNA-binding NtrC family response regulator
MPNIDLALVICDRTTDRQNIIGSALKCGLAPICCSNLEEARFLLPQAEYRMIFCDEKLSDGDFRAVIRESQQSITLAPVIVFGRSYDWDSYLKALAAGAYDYVVCPPSPAEVERIIWLALADTVGVENVSHAAA